MHFLFILKDGIGPTMLKDKFLFEVITFLIFPLVFYPKLKNYSNLEIYNLNKESVPDLINISIQNYLR